VRLRRLVPGASYREELQQLVLPLEPKERAAESLLALLRDLVPPDKAPKEGLGSSES
jgi:hypothetical protein